MTGADIGEMTRSVSARAVVLSEPHGTGKQQEACEGATATLSTAPGPSASSGARLGSPGRVPKEKAGPDDPASAPPYAPGPRSLPPPPPAAAEEGSAGRVPKVQRGPSPTTIESTGAEYSPGPGPASAAFAGRGREPIVKAGPGPRRAAAAAAAS